MIRLRKILLGLVAGLVVSLTVSGCTAMRTFVTANAPRAQMGACGRIGGCAGAYVSGAEGAALQRGDYNAAIASYSEIAATAPNDENALVGRGLAYLANGNYEPAIANFTDAIRLDPNDALAHNDRGVAYYRQGNYAQAIGEYNDTIRLVTERTIRPAWLTDAYWNRAAAYFAQGDYRRSIADYDTAIGFLPGGGTLKRPSEQAPESPRQAAAHQDRGFAYAKSGDYDRAIADFTAALNFQDPKEPLTYFDRGNAYFAKGDRDTASGDYHTAAQMLADAMAETAADPVTLNAAAWILATCPDSQFRQGITAVGYAKQACDLTSRENPEYLDTLAAAYAENGDFSQAAETEHQAISKTTIAFQISTFRKRLELYESSKPYRSDLK
ncbi:MAG: tetratricopeptide repeat protein [Candidatus Binataceae bacterium]